MKTFDTVDKQDADQLIRLNLKDKALSVYELLKEETRPQSFIDKYGNGQPKTYQVAEYLGLKTKDIKESRKNILVITMAFNGEHR